MHLTFQVRVRVPYQDFEVTLISFLRLVPLMNAAQVDVGGGSCRKHGGGRRCGADGCMKTDVGGECWSVETAKQHARCLCW